MLVVWGSKLYGKVDEIEDVGFVATQFGHLFWIPLIPFNSYFVTRQESHHFEGAPLGLQWKSVLVGYGRVFSALFFLAGLAALNTIYGPGHDFDPAKMNTYRTMVALGVFSIPLGIATQLPSMRRADDQEATRLADYLRFDDRLCARVELAYGKITAEEAQRRMGDLGAPQVSVGGNEIGGNEFHSDDDEIAAAYRRYMSASPAS
ncbi:MAG: hypothetical protein KDA44_01475 [Planctomycetales bacterium]|nr:hypothetical protein [Planctomycetales bacterium]